MRVFVDTGAWIALVAQTDNHHREGFAYFDYQLQRGSRFTTTDFVLDESITRLSYDYGHSVAVDFLTLIKSAQLEGQLLNCRISESDFTVAESLFLKYHDVKLSFTDCTSFAVMRRLNLSGVFGYDAHFEMMGFTLNPV